MGAASGVMLMTQPAITQPLPDEVADFQPFWLAPGELGALVNPPAFEADSIPAVLAGHFLFDYYYRIWVLPEVMNAQNPLVGVPIPFAIWNAYPQPVTNALESIIATSDTGLIFDFDVADDWKAIEYKVVHITITPDAPNEIAASFELGFEEGVGFFYFNAALVDFVYMVPDPPVTEVWAWLTDVIASRDNTEQRIGLRSTPRRSIKYGFMLEDETERRRQYGRWFRSVGGRIALPYYQYATKLTEPSLVGDSKLWFDPAMTDVRDGDLVIVLEEATMTGYVVKLDTVEADGATTVNPLAFAPTAKMIVAPAFVSMLADRSGLTMRTVTGHIDISAQALGYRTPFKRPGSTAVIETYDDIPVLHLRPVAVSETPEIFDANYETVDSDTGLQEIYVSWPHPDVGTARKWSIRRRQNPVEMDWWRDFLDDALGQRDPFLMPTWFADLVLAADPAVGATQLVVTAPDYSSLYYPFETFKRLQLETEAGIIWRRVTGVTDNPGGTTTLNLDTALGGTAPEVAISKISFLNLVRLASDNVTLTHDRLRSQIELTTKTVDV